MSYSIKFFLVTVGLMTLACLNPGVPTTSHGDGSIPALQVSSEQFKSQNTDNYAPVLASKENTPNESNKLIGYTSGVWDSIQSDRVPLTDDKNTYATVERRDNSVSHDAQPAYQPGSLLDSTFERHRADILDYQPNSDNQSKEDGDDTKERSSKR